MNNQLITQLQQKISLSKSSITNILKLLDDGATIPFIARYRKEMTDGATDETLREFEIIYVASQKLLKRKEDILRLIEERATLTPSIKKQVEEAQTLLVLEDIYRPYKESKTSRASVAITSGYEPLARILKSARLTKEQFIIKAKEYNPLHVDAIKGAKDIIAQEYSNLVKERDSLRNSMLNYGTLEIKKGKNFNEKGNYLNFVDKSEKVAYIPSHRYLALMRGVSQKELSLKITIDLDRVQANILKYKIGSNSSTCRVYLLDAYLDGLKRLMLPSLEREVHNILKQKADEVAINTFGKNLQQLLMTPCVVNRVILGVDPAFVSGCKLAVIDENGTYLAHSVIYPTAPKSDYENSKNEVLRLVDKYNITAVAIGNGTGSRETQEFFSKINSDEKRAINYTVVSEAGASIYSASKLAQEEYPSLDVTIRGALSIAGRVHDPMATFVKIDPKSLGIGQYQHDVEQKLLTSRLNDITQSIVSSIGVNVNSASQALLLHVAGIGASIAKNIVEYREKNGEFKSKKELLKVKGLGAKAYEQLAGFIRVPNSTNSLDNTGIHPESYEVAKKLLHVELDSIVVDELAPSLHVGEETLKEIIKELKKPGFDPREELPPIPFKEGITDIKMLKVGSIVTGVVRNIADFGAFIDIGLKNDGLIHISKMSKTRIKHPLEKLHINQYLLHVEVIEIDQERQRVGLSLV